MIRFPKVAGRLGLGVGLDLRWSGPDGFEGARISSSVVRYFERTTGRFGYAFFSHQPRSRARLRAEDYYPAYDDLVNRALCVPVRAMHHTLLNLGAVDRYDRREILEATNRLIARYDLAWINEDVGIWSLAGKSLPYPLPPYFSKRGLEACIRNVNEVQAGLDAPLLLEFPGFSSGSSLAIGSMHAFDFFSVLAIETKSPVTLDVGHLLSYAWRRDQSIEALKDDLERLPLAHAFELHLSGCEVRGEEFLDLHHGVLLDEQLALVETLLSRCPNLKAITFEDPKFDADGVLHPAAERNFERLAAIARSWAEAG